MTEPLPAYQTNDQPKLWLGSPNPERWWLIRRQALADELRFIEDVLMSEGYITKRLCKPGKRR